MEGQIQNENGECVEEKTTRPKCNKQTMATKESTTHVILYFGDCRWFAGFQILYSFLILYVWFQNNCKNQKNL